MSGSERWLGTKVVLPSGPSPVIGEGREDGTVRPSPFENLVPRPAPVQAEPEETADTVQTFQDDATESAVTVTPEATAEEPEVAMFPADYEPVTRRGRNCPACIFVLADGRAFGRCYGDLHGINWLKGAREDGRDGFAVTYSGFTVEVRGRGLWPLFLALNEQRACAVRQFDPDRWMLPPSGPVVTHITAKLALSL